MRLERLSRSVEISRPFRGLSALLATGLATILAAVLAAFVGAGAASAQLGLDGSKLFEQGVAGIPDVSNMGDRFGQAVAAGDFDGDGDDDLAIGASDETVSAFVGVGQVTIVYSDGETLDPSTATTIATEDLGVGNATLDESFGETLVAADFDGDTFDDLAIASPWRFYLPMGGGGAANTGVVFVIYGGVGGLDLGRIQVLIPGVDGLAGMAEDDDHTGLAMVAGDFDGNGKADLVLGIPHRDAGAHLDTGSVLVVYGQIGGLFLSDSEHWTQGMIGLDADGTGEQFGAALAAGDWNDDGKDDLAVGTPHDEVFGAPSAGSVSLLWGSDLGLTTIGAQRITEAGATPGTFGGEDYFGLALASGDFDCDGDDDLAVGVPGEDRPIGNALFMPNAGAVVLHYGSDLGIDPSSGLLFDHELVGPPKSQDFFGSALAAGDFDGDGCDDVVVGTPGSDPDGSEGAGSAFVLAGAPGGVPVFSFEASQAGPAPGIAQAGTHFGGHLAVGDFDRDGASDLAAGTPLHTAGGEAEAGTVNVFFGDASLFLDGFESGDVAEWSSSEG